MSTVNEDLLNNMIKHKIQIDRVSSGISSRVFNSIKKLIKESIEIPDNIQDLSEIQVNILKADIEKKIKDVIVIEYGNFESELKEYVLYEKEYILNSTGRIMPSAIALKASEITADKAIERMKVQKDNLIAKNAFEKIANKASIDYGNTLIQGYKNGSNGIEIGRKLYNLENKADKTSTELKKIRNDLNTLSRTCCNSIHQEVNRDFLERNDDLIDGYLFVSTLDTNTTSICGSLDGKRFEKGAEPNLPLHYNCRSILLPIIRGSDDLNIGTRKAMDGKVPKTQNYETWLKNQDRQTIEEVLGKKKAQLFIDGKIPLERFVDLESAKALTLREVAIKEGIDFNEIKK